MKNSTHRILALLLCLALACSMLAGCGNSSAQMKTAAAEPTAVLTVEDCISEGEDLGPEVYTAPERTAVPFDEMSDSNFDEAAAYEALDQLTNLCSQPHTLKQIKAAYDVLIDQYDRLYTDYCIAEIRYYQDVTDDAAAEKETELTMTVTRYADSAFTALAAVLASPYRDAMISYMNDANIVNDADGYSAMDADEMALIGEESRLTQEYETLYASDDATMEDFEQLYLDLLDNRIAQAAFYEDYTDYADYAYEATYARDFSPADVGSLCDWARDFAVPMMSRLQDVIWNSGNYDPITYFSRDFSAEETIARVQPWVSTVSDKAAADFQTMVDLGLFDLGDSDTKADSGFTTSLTYYGVPFIFNSPYGYAQDAETLIHEFGHAYEAFTNARPEAYVYDCYDTCEIDSQGMEVLMFAYADEIFGEDIGSTVLLENLYYLLRSVVDGCVFDKFQQEAFAAREAGTLQTPEQVTELFLKVEESIIGDYEEAWGRNWVNVPHTYENPFYYISYATSAAAALSLLTVAAQSQDDAVSVYNELVALGCEQGFVNTMQILGLPNPLTADGEAQMTDGLTDYLAAFLGE